MKRLFRTSFAALIAALFSITMISCKPDEPDTPGGGNGGGQTGPTTVAVTGVSISKSSLSLIEGGSETLTATVSPDNATNKSVSWKSSATDIASVDRSGKVTAVKVGSATITVTTSDGSKTAACAVTVMAKTVEVSDVALDKAELEIIKGESYQFTVTLKPEDATDKTLSWSSSDNNVVTVDGSGKITAVETGKTTVTVKTSNSAQSASCEITVIPATVSVTGINIDNWVINLPVGETEAVRYTIHPEDATDTEVTFSSDNTGVVAVDSDGTLVGVSAGTATVTVTTKDGGFSSVCTVNVIGSVGSIEVDGFFYKDYGPLALALIPDPSGQKAYSGDITIPGKVTYKGVEYTVENISDRMFFCNDGLTSVTLGEGVRNIDAYAFTGCENLEKVFFPSTLEDYNRYNEVFANCPKLEIEVDPSNEFFFVKDKGLYQNIWGKKFLRWIPEKLTGTFAVVDGTTDFASYSVYQTSIDKLVIPTSINFIYERFLCNGCKTPLEIVLSWTTIAEVNRIEKYYDDPSPFYLYGLDRSKVTVSVPAGTKAFYQAHWLWGACGKIVER